MITDNWERIVTQTRLTDEPYPRAKIRCTECEQTWDDDDEEKCVCDEDEEEELPCAMTLAKAAKEERILDDL